MISVNVFSEGYECVSKKEKEKKRKNLKL